MVSSIKLVALANALALSRGFRVVKNPGAERDGAARKDPEEDAVAEDVEAPATSEEPEEVSAQWSQCGKSGPSSLIVNGDDAPECKWRWQVSLQDDIGHFCGGMLIRPDWVLTAAHCLGGTFQVVAGEWRLSRKSGKEQVMTIKQYIGHPRYNNSNTDYDIALLQLSRPMQMNSCVGTVCLPTRNVSVGSTCAIAGWGMLESGGRLTDILQEAEVTVFSNKDCEDMYSGRGNITSSMLCAQGRARNGSITDACQGDSGGPLMCESSGTWTIHGATSWGRGCADRRYPGVWSRVFHTLGWIEGIVGSSPSPSPSPSPPPPSPPSPSPTGRFVVMPIVRSMLDASGRFMPSCELWSSRKYRTITSRSECKSAVCALGYDCATPGNISSPRGRPYGCGVQPSRNTFLNLHEDAEGNGSREGGPSAICAESR
jgi:trypsin